MTRETIGVTPVLESIDGGGLVGLLLVAFNVCSV